MSLPFFANLFAFRAGAPDLDREICSRLEASGELGEHREMPGGWRVAQAPLPGSAGDPGGVTGAGLVFAEGREHVLGSDYDEETMRERAGEVAKAVMDGPEALRRLPGDFAFLSFGSEGEVRAVRACAGVVPFYHFRRDGLEVIATRLNYIHRFLPFSLPVDPMIHALWACGEPAFPGGRTFLRGVTIQDRATLATVAPGRALVSESYWDPRPRTWPAYSRSTEEEHARQLRSLLLDKLERDLCTGEGNLISLSGGVDSSALTALAGLNLGREIWTLSLFPGPEKLFDYQMSFIAPLMKRVGVTRHWIRRVSVDYLLRETEAGPQDIFYLIHPCLCELAGIVQEAEVKVYLGGDFADEVCGSIMTLPDVLDSLGPVELLGFLGKSPTGPRVAASWVKRKILNLLRRQPLRYVHRESLPDWVHPRVREEYRDHRSGVLKKFNADQGPWRNLHQYCSVDGWLAMNWEGTSSLGVRRSIPFFNREVLELAFACHPRELYGPGIKQILRRALDGDVPHHNLYRATKGSLARWLEPNARIKPKRPVPALLSGVVREELCGKLPSRVDRRFQTALNLMLRFSDYYERYRDS